MTPPLSLHVERTIDATPRQVFDAWTTPAELAKWWTPPGGRCVTASVDLRLGGTYAIVNELPGGGIVTITGEYLTIEPSSLLRFTWTTDVYQPATETVTVTFEADGPKTKLGIVHARMPSREVAEGHSMGWKSCLDGLVSFMATSP